MPRYQRTKPRGWYCNGCGLFYEEKPLAVACEAKHAAFQAYADGTLDELGLAQHLGYDVSTPREKQIAVQRIRDMVGDATRPMTAPQKGEGYLVNVTVMHSNGRVQVPHQIRKVLGLNDGDPVYWYRMGDLFYVSSTEMKADWRRGKMSRRGM